MLACHRHRCAGFPPTPKRRPIHRCNRESRRRDQRAVGANKEPRHGRTGIDSDRTRDGVRLLIGRVLRCEGLQRQDTGDGVFLPEQGGVRDECEVREPKSKEPRKR